MFKNVPWFSRSFSLAIFVVSSLVFVGCTKKVSSVSGSAGLSTETAMSSRPSPSTKPNVDTSGSAPSGLSDSLGGEAPISSQPEEHASLGKSTPDEEQGSVIAAASGAPGVEFSENIYFDFDKWSIRSDTKDVLGENAQWLMKHVDLQVQIEGHGDERGSNEYNLALGERRARSTRRYLINLGVDSSRISFISYGEEKSLCSEKNEHCFQKNRRAHFLVKR